MSKFAEKVSIWDIENKNCTEEEKNALINALEYTIKKLGLARKSFFALEDYYTSKMYGIDRFSLVIERKTTVGADHFYAVFENGNKYLKVIATLEK